MSDKLVWLSMKGGSKPAFEKIYLTNFHFLLNYGYKICGQQSLIEDCIQELFVEIWNKKSGLSETDHIRKYLTVSFRRKLIRALSKQNKLSQLEETDIRLNIIEPSVEHRMFENEFIEARTEKVKQAINQLSPRQKEIIYLKFYAEMKNNEIADIMNINYQSVRNLLVKALKNLSKALQLFLVLLGYIFAIACLC